jgi:hypothetical protein
MPHLRTRFVPVLAGHHQVPRFDQIQPCRQKPPLPTDITGHMDTPVAGVA